MGTIDVHDTHTPRRKGAPGICPVERRRGCVPAGSSREYRSLRRSFVGKRSPARSLQSLPRTTSCAVYVLGSRQWWRRGFQHRRLGVRLLPGLLIRVVIASTFASILTTAEHRRRVHLSMDPHGSVAPWGAAGGNPAVFPTQGVRFLSDPRPTMRVTPDR